VKSVFFASFLVLSGIGWCQMPAQDFSKGFELLAGLGMPPLDPGATWAKVTDPNSMDYSLREYTRSLKGNGWVIRGKDGTLRQVPLGSLTEVEMPEKGKEPPAQDLGKDVEAIIDALNKAAAKKDPDEIFSEYRYSSIDPLLLFATQLHQTGRKDLANRLAHATFAFFPTRESAINAVVNRIAEQFHQTTVSAFFEAGDWSAYHRDLSALVERYPRGWDNAGAVRLMLPQLARQAKGKTAPAPALPGTTLDPQAVAILHELMQPPKRDGKKVDDMKGMPPHVRQRMLMMHSMGHGYEHGGGGFHQNLWLISPDKPESGGPESRLAALGMAALPALAAVAEDSFFTHQPNSGSRNHSYSSRESEDDRILRAYQSLSRPATRGEIATRMLVLTLPDPENELGNADPSTIRELAMDFHKTHQKATPEQLAAVFLKEGSEEQSTQAVDVLAKSKNPDAHKMFEDHVLAADPAIGLFESVRTYLKERKAEGKPFFDQYAQLVRKQTPDAGDSDSGHDRNSWKIKEADGVEKILKQLQSVAEGESPRAMAIRIGKEEDVKTASASIRGLMEAMGGEEPRKQLIALLSGAYAAAKDENVRAQFLTTIFQIEWDAEIEDPDGGEDEEKEDGKQPATRVISEAEGKVWQRLIADSRPLKSTQGRYSIGAQPSTVSSLACAALEASVVGHEFYSLMQAIPIMARPADEVLTERAKARLAGKPVPPLPNAENIAPARLAAIVSETGEKPAAEVHAYLLTLSMDERAAWAEWLQNPGDVPVPDNIKQLRHQVVKQAETGVYAPTPMPDFDAVPVGFQVTEKSVDALMQTLASQTEKYSRSIIVLMATSFGPGLEASASVFPFPEPKGEEEKEDPDPYSRVTTADMIFPESLRFFQSDDASDAVIHTSIPGKRSEAIWNVKNGKATRVQVDGGEDTFAQALQTALDAENPRALRLQIRMITRADAEKLNTNHE
jgi:hypothetical protein